MIVLAIDPAPIQSGYCLIDSDNYKPIQFGKIYNDYLLEVVSKKEFDIIAIEMIASMGMVVGASVFDTCVYIGRVLQEAKDIPYQYIYRREEKMNLCNSMKAKDANIRQALIDRFGEVGTKNNQGWFYGFKADIWSAYAVGVTYLDIYHNKNDS